jgi:long-chain acyl-CoA synthetase
MSLNLGTILQGTASERGDHTALIIGEQSISYAELHRGAQGIAQGLLDLGLQPGDKISVMQPNVPQFPLSYFGILYAGMTVVPLNVLLTGEEVQYHLEDSDSKLLIGHPMFEASATAGAAAAGIDVVWAEGSDGKSLMDMAAGEPIERLHPTGADDTAVILYTSGTTGRAKGAELSHSNVFVNSVDVVPRLIPLQGDDVSLATLPLFHTFGQTVVMNATLGTGGTVVLLPRFTPEDAFGLIQKHKVTMFAGVPTMYFGLLHHPDGDSYDVSSLRYALTGGAAMPVEVLKAFEERFPVVILEGYGLSETSPVASFNVPDKPRNAGSIGYPVWGVEMAIMDEDDNEVEDGERGEICIRGHNIMKGYWQRPEANAETMKNGWFHSGDIGIRNPEGWFSIVDRVKDMIIRGGYNVYPREIEEVLYAHPAITEAAVIGVPHEQYGEEVRAVVVVAEGQELSEQDVIDYTREHVAAYKYPRTVGFLDTLPKGPTGKILKRELS